jgi:DNA replication protein DnaC
MITPVPLDDVDAMLKRLHLPTIRRLYADLAVRAEQEGMSYRTFLEVLCAEEIAHRAQTRITRCVRKARFPYLRTIEEFDFTYQTSVRMQMLGTLLGPELVSEGRCAIISGAPAAVRRTSPSPSRTAPSRTASTPASPLPTS